jgi:hypothetical protein
MSASAKSAESAFDRSVTGKTMQPSMQTTSLYETQPNQDLWLLRCVMCVIPIGPVTSGHYCQSVE